MLSKPVARRDSPKHWVVEAAANDQFVQVHVGPERGFDFRQVRCSWLAAVCRHFGQAFQSLPYTARCPRRSLSKLISGQVECLGQVIRRWIRLGRSLTE